MDPSAQRRGSIPLTKHHFLPGQRPLGRAIILPQRWHHANEDLVPFLLPITYNNNIACMFDVSSLCCIFLVIKK